MASNKRAKICLNMYHSYIIYIYSERGHSGLQDYVFFEKSNFLRKIDFRSGGSPLMNVILIEQINVEEYY